MKNPLLIKYAQEALKFAFNFASARPLPEMDITVEESDNAEFKTRISLCIQNFSSKEEYREQVVADIKVILDTLRDGIDAFKEIDLSKVSRDLAESYLDGMDPPYHLEEFDFENDEDADKIVILTTASVKDILNVLKENIPENAQKKAQRVFDSI